MDRSSRFGEKMELLPTVNQLSRKIRKLNLKQGKKKQQQNLDPFKAWLKSLPTAADIATETPIIPKVETIDEKYELLDKLLNGLVFSIQFLQVFKSAQTFASVYPIVERMSNRSFTYGHLAQLKFILPEVIQIEKTFIQDDWTGCAIPHLLLNMDFGIVHKAAGTTPSMMNPVDLSVYENKQTRKFFKTRLMTFFKSHPEALDVPSLAVSIDEYYSIPDATLLQVSFGGSLGALNDSINELKHLGVDVAKRTITAEGSEIKIQAFVTQVSTGCKVEDPALLEDIRVTIISNLLKYSQESRMGEAVDEQEPLKRQ